MTKLEEKLAAVKRGTVGYDDEDCVCIFEDPNGNWVKYLDYEALKRAFDEAVRQRNEWFRLLAIEFYPRNEARRDEVIIEWMETGENELLAAYSGEVKT